MKLLNKLNKKTGKIVEYNKDEDTFEWEGDAILETNKWNEVKEKLK